MPSRITGRWIRSGWRIFWKKSADWKRANCATASTGRRVKAIIPVHILGHPVNMKPILELARKFNLVVIEDATESLGAKYEGHPTGSLADIACFSFNGNKIITTGGGGMITTNDEAWARRAKYLTTQAKDDPVEYIHNEIGYNYRLTNMQAAMGCAQLEQLDDYVAKKRHIAETYLEAFKNVPGITPMREAPWAFSNFWLFTVLIDAKLFGKTSRQLLKALAEKKIQSRPLWQPIHLSPAHAGCQPQPCPTAEMLYENCLSLPCSVGLNAIPTWSAYVRKPPAFSRRISCSRMIQTGRDEDDITITGERFLCAPTTSFV